MKLKKSLSNVKLLVLDVDGVLTDGAVYISDEGREYKKFSIHDGLGLKLIQDNGIKVAIISSSESKAVTFRAQALGILEIHIGVNNKLSILDQIVKKYTIGWPDVIYVGDDLVDLECMEQVGLPMSVANGHNIIKGKSVYVTKSNGGNGAVREICDLILNGF